MGYHKPGNGTPKKWPPSTLPERLQEIYLNETNNSDCEKSPTIDHDMGVNQICAIDSSDKKGKNGSHLARTTLDFVKEI